MAEYEDEMAYEDESSMVSPLQMMMSGFTTVTPEGKAKAAEVFDSLYDQRSVHDEDEQKAYNDYETQARAARETLRRAREVLAAKKVPSTRYLEMARGFGAPTRAGSFGESIANYADARIPGRQRETDWEQNRDSQLLQFDQGMSGIDQTLALQKLKLRQARRAADDKLMIESMKIMGKPVPGAGKKTPRQEVQASLDKAYAKDYLSFIQGGAAEADKHIKELRRAKEILVGNPEKGTTGTDMVSGPVIGLVPKVLRDIFLPKSSETQENIESTVQSSLKEILGHQFTEKEGTALLARVYNPRFEEHVNARRAQSLIDRIERAYAEKVKAAQYFEQNGTLDGYKGKTTWSLDNFDIDLPEDDDPAAIAGEMLDTVAGGTPPARRPGPAAPAPAPDEGMEEIDIEMLLPAHARGGVVKKFAEGGPVQGEFPDGRPRFRMPDGKVIRARPGDDYETVLQVYTTATGTAPSRPGIPPQQIPPRGMGGQEGPGPAAQIAPVGAPPARPPMMEAQAEQPPEFSEVALGELPSALGYTAAGAAGAGLGDRLLTGVGDRLIPGRRENPAQRRVLDMLQEQRRSPADVVAGVRQQQRMGIPAMAMDDPALRPTADTVLPETGLQNASIILQRLNSRADNLEGRVTERVNQGLKPDDYFEQEEKLKSDLYANSKPLYQQAYTQFPTVKSKVLPALLNTPDGKKAVKTALRIMRNDGKKIGKQDAMGMVTSPSLEFLDNVKRGLDDLITKEEGHGMNYKATALGKSLRGLRDSLRNELDAATTVKGGDSLYAKARAQYEGDLEVLDALRMGREKFDKLEPQQLAKLTANMSFSAKDAFRTGAAQALFETLAAPTADVNSARRVIGSTAMRAKLRPLFDTDKQYQLFETALEREAELHDLDKKSIRRAESGQELHAQPAPGAIKRAAKHVPRLGIKSPTMWALQYIRNNSQATEKKMDEVLEHLKASTPDELADLEKTLGPKFNRRLKRQGRAGKTAVAGAAIGAAAKVADAAMEDEVNEDAEYAEGGKVGKVSHISKLLRQNVHRLFPQDTGELVIDLSDSGLSIDEQARKARELANTHYWGDRTGQVKDRPVEVGADSGTFLGNNLLRAYHVASVKPGLWVLAPKPLGPAQTRPLASKYLQPPTVDDLDAE